MATAWRRTKLRNDSCGNGVSRTGSLTSCISRTSQQLGGTETALFGLGGSGRQADSWATGEIRSLYPIQCAGFELTNKRILLIRQHALLGQLLGVDPGKVSELDAFVLATEGLGHPFPHQSH